MFGSAWTWWYELPFIPYSPYRPYPPIVPIAPMMAQAEPGPGSEAPAEPAAAIAPPPRFRYYCPDRGYYPQVQTCPVDFVRQPIP